MHQFGTLGQLGREPVYNTRAVAERTGVPADTFRAWERRYGVPRPSRAAGNQRLYSEFDIGLIAWLRDRTAEGMQISLAAQRLKLMFPDAVVVSAPTAVTVAGGTDDPQDKVLTLRLVEALLDYDTAPAERVIDEALARYSVERVCASVLHPTLVEITTRFQSGDTSASQERFATRLIGRRLGAIFDMVSPSVARGTFVACCAPTDDSEVGLLLLCVCLAHRGWRVIFLGAGVPTHELVGTLRQLNPDLVCLGVGRSAALPRALAAARELSRANLAPVALACGGLRAGLPTSVEMPANTYVVTGDPVEQASEIERVMSERDSVRAAPLR